MKANIVSTIKIFKKSDVVHETFRSFSNSGNNISDIKTKLVAASMSILEETVVKHGFLTNYGSFFAVVENSAFTNPNKVWFVIEYRPTFQFIKHFTVAQILDFAKVIGVKII